jgi:hypothetical protein
MHSAPLVVLEQIHEGNVRAGRLNAILSLLHVYPSVNSMK